MHHRKDHTEFSESFNSIDAIVSNIKTHKTVSREAGHSKNCL